MTNQYDLGLYLIAYSSSLHNFLSSHEGHMLPDYKRDAIMFERVRVENALNHLKVYGSLQPPRTVLSLKFSLNEPEVK